MKGAALFVFFCVCASAQPGAVEGVVVHAVTGQPLSGVHIRLVAGDFGSASEAYGAMSDSAGRFSMARVPAGAYILSAERTGFVYVRKTPVAGPAASLAVKAGEHMADLKLEMAPRAIVAGRVVDENGDPVAGVSMMLEAVSTDLPRGAGMVSGFNMSNDHGEFRLRAAPGKYRVRAMPRPMYLAPEPEGPVYGPTYFPGTTNRDQASVVEVAAGGEVDGVEIRLARRSGFTISGVVSGMPDNGVPTVALQFGESPGRVRSTSGRAVQHDGKFRFDLMEPGFYRIFAAHPAGKPPLQSQAVDFKLDNGDVTNLQLALAPGGEISGTLELVGGAAPAEKRAVRLKADMLFGMGRLPSAEIDKDGAFHITNVLPQKFRVLVDPLPENAYIKTVQVDGAEAPRGVLDFSAGAHDAKLKITIGRNGGQISGSVVNKSSPGTMVYLLQDPEDTPQDRMARVTAEGKYSFKAIRPGKYRVFAIEPPAFDAREDVIKQAFNKAEEIEIKEGDRIAKDLKVAEGSHAK
jgi:hypothetical protein